MSTLQPKEAPFTAVEATSSGAAPADSFRTPASSQSPKNYILLSQRPSTTNHFQGNYGGDLSNQINDEIQTQPRSGSGSSFSEALENLDISLALPFVGLAEDTRNLSLEVALDPRRGNLERDSSYGSNTPGSRQNSISAEEDPISLKILGFPAAQNLYDGFFQHFNYLVGAIDPVLYELSYCKVESPLLFTVILSISSRVFTPELHPLLRDHVEKLLGKALLDCDTSISTIWPIVCLYYWKDVSDKRGYNLIGFALRMASSAKWNRMEKDVTETHIYGHLTAEQMRERRFKRDQLRAWLLLGMPDRSASYFSSRPLTANPNTSGAASRSWIGDAATTYQNGDSTAVAGNELNDLARKLYDFITRTKHNKQSKSSRPPRGSSDDTFGLLLQEFNEKVQDWGDYWGPYYRNFINPSLEPLVYTYQEHMRLYFNTIRLQRLVSRTSRNSWDEIERDAIMVRYSSTLRLLEQIIAVGKLHMLYYLWDTAHLMTAYSAMILGKILQNVPHLIPTSSLTTLSALATLYAIAAASIAAPRSPDSSLTGKSPTKSALDVQAKYLRSIVMRVKLAHSQRSTYTPPASIPPSAYAPTSRFQETEIYLQQQQQQQQDAETSFAFASPESLTADTAGEALQLDWGVDAGMDALQDYGGESMDFLIDNDLLAYVAGLLPWSVPGNFNPVAR